MSAAAPAERVGIVGAGAAATLHLQALRRIPGLRVVGICDLDGSRAAALAARFGVSAGFSDLSRFYAEGRPQSVHIVTPPHAHEALAAAALDHGAHVLVEKPPALTVAGCGALLRQAHTRGLAIGVNENTAADPLVRQARTAIEAGRLGRVLHIDGYYSFGLHEGELVSGWADRLPGGMLEDLLPHLLTVSRALAGHRLTPAYWKLGNAGGASGRPHDEIRLFLTGRDGLMVSLTLSLFARPRAFSLVIRGTSGSLAVDLRRRLLQEARPGSRGGALGVGLEIARSAAGMLYQTGRNVVGLATGSREGVGSFQPLIRAHYMALAASAELPAPLKRAAETVEIVRAIWPLEDPQ